MMLLASSGFVTICPKKEVELGADKLLHRANHDEELRQEIAFDEPKATGNKYAHLPGGAVRAINPNSSMTLAEANNCIAVFKGNLANRAELAMQLVGCLPHVTEAQLLLQLYTTVGLDMLGRLHGQYAFCLYDSKQARVLAARDHSGAVPLVEGRTAAGSLIIACGTFLPKGTTQMVEIKPGEYKYGWHALPRAFQCGAKIVSGRASCDYGIRRRSIDAYNAPQRTKSLDIPKQNQHHSQYPNQHQQQHLGTPGSSLGHTPSRYMPPHAAAAAAAGGFSSGNGFSIRQRATSVDGAHLHFHSRPTYHNHQQNSSSYTGHHQWYHHATPPSSGRRRSDTSTYRPPASGSHQHWAPKTPLSVQPLAAHAAHTSTAAVASPAAAGTATPSLTPADRQDSQCSHLSAASDLSAAADVTSPHSSDTPHRRKRRHRRSRHSRSAAAGTAAATTSEDDHHSDTESHFSSSTHDGVHAEEDAVKELDGLTKHVLGQLQEEVDNVSDSEAAIAVAQAATEGQTAAASSTQHQVLSEQQETPQQDAEGQQQQHHHQEVCCSANGGGFKRIGSCGELAALGSSSAATALLAAPQGLAC